MYNLPSYKLFPFSDSALIIDFGNTISRDINDAVVCIFKKIQSLAIDGVIEVVPAYSSIVIYYNVFELKEKITGEQTVFQFLEKRINKLLREEEWIISGTKQKVIRIPVCYEKEFATDLEWMSSQLKISNEEIIQLHTSKSYHVYMLGFLPGFSYMGEVDEKISIARKPQPVQVTAGSVGIAGKQTGVYPLNSPGGWQIIGRTPLIMFDKDNTEPTKVKPGDTVQFYSISKDEYTHFKSRLT